MKPPTFVRTLTVAEQQQLQAGLRAADAFTVRRCQVLLASAKGQRASTIARNLGCAVGTVHNALRAFARAGLACLQEQSSRPHSARAFLDARFTDPLKELLHQSPRLFGQPTSLWTLDRVAAVCHGKGWTPRQLTGEAIRVTLKRLGIRWRRAKHWITSPDPAYARKKKARDRLIRLARAHPDWVLGYQDETWWSRLAQPALHTWATAGPLRLLELAADKGDPDPKALACYGLLRGDTGGMLLRFVEGRPVSQVTEEFLAWVCQRLGREGKRALLLIWDNASWHVSGRVRAWIKAHNRQAKRDGGVRILACCLPSKSPWLNAIEPKWVHGKKAIAEPGRRLAAPEIKARVCNYYGVHLFKPLKQRVA
jgi:transposase